MPDDYQEPHEPNDEELAAIFEKEPEIDLVKAYGAFLDAQETLAIAGRVSALVWVATYASGEVVELANPYDNTFHLKGKHAITHAHNYGNRRGYGVLTSLKPK